MNDYKNIWNVNIRKSSGYLLFVLLLVFLLSVSFVVSLPTAPVAPTYISNTTSGLVNRSIDAKGTITTVTLSSTQQDYKWKAYVGNVTGKLALSNAGGQAIYDWTSGTPTGEVYVSRFSSITWASIACADQTAINNEQTGISMGTGIRDNINATFNYTTHTPFLTGVVPLSGCRSTATYVNNAAQSMSSARFQEILLMSGGNLVYAGLINASSAGYDNNNYDFQMIIAENESSTIPSTYFFWVELG